MFGDILQAMGQANVSNVVKFFAHNFLDKQILFEISWKKILEHVHQKSFWDLRMNKLRSVWLFQGSGSCDQLWSSQDSGGVCSQDWKDRKTGQHREGHLLLWQQDRQWHCCWSGPGPCWQSTGECWRKPGYFCQQGCLVLSDTFLSTAQSNQELMKSNLSAPFPVIMAFEINFNCL